MGRAEPFAMQSSRSAGTCSRFDGLHQVDKLLARMNPHFRENALRVGPHGVLRYDQLFGHIRHIAATGKEVENLGLATRQTVTLDSNRAACKMCIRDRNGRSRRSSTSSPSGIIADVALIPISVYALASAPSSSQEIWLSCFTIEMKAGAFGDIYEETNK